MRYRNRDLVNFGRTLILCMTILLIVAGTARSQGCFDWRSGLLWYQDHTEISGSVGLVGASDTYYFGNDNTFLVADISAVDAPVIIGSVTMPSPITKIKEIGDFL